MLEKLIRETVRMEAVAIEHAVREARRLGDAPPSHALDRVAAHAGTMRDRFTRILAGHDLGCQRPSIGSTLSTLRHLVVDRATDAEQAFRAAILDLRHGIEVVRLLREVVHAEGLFGLIRWCDDWLRARRTLVTGAEAQLGWFDESDADGEMLLVLDEDPPQAPDTSVASPSREALPRAGDRSPTDEPELHPGSPRRRDRP